MHVVIRGVTPNCEMRRDFEYIRKRQRAHGIGKQQCTAVEGLKVKHDSADGETTRSCIWDVCNACVDTHTGSAGRGNSL